MKHSANRPSDGVRGTEKLPHLVFYDDRCSLCLKEINHYKKLNTSHPIKWIPIYQEEEVIQQYGFHKQDLLERLHVVRGDGVIVTGVSAFATIWSSIKWYRPIGIIVYKLHLIPILDIAYRYFAKWRFKRQACEI
jgi:predicted DCC family thiol-disulfide oxidoreductase YuxK